MPDAPFDGDIAIIGAGPAGATAAALLARDGRDAHVFDKSTFPRDKCCGDGLTTLALRELDAIGFDPSTVASWQQVDDVVIRSPRGRERRYSLPEGAGYHAAVARREDFDAALVDLARSDGAKINEGMALTGVEPDDDGVTLCFGDSSFRARHLIAADGMWSPVRKHLGLSVDGYRGEWHAFRQYFSNVSPRAASELMVWFDEDLLPGYAWSFPLDDERANVGFGIQRGSQRYSIGDMKQLWPDLLARPHIREFLGADAEPESPHKAWPIPARVGRVPLVGPHTMFVGDAAAVTDPMTGEGIGQAILTGRLAAEALLAGGDALAHYEHETRRELVADDRMARVLVPLLANPTIAGAALKATGATAWTRRNFARWMFEDYPRAMVATPRRWHRGMFTGPGAYADTNA
ncbi:MAG: NAD(P)/FAD-dependent oxidoreductase [Actinomycetota bacterium]